MIPTIEALEQEIQQFHKNVSDSNALMKALSDLLTAAKAQTAAFDAKTAELQALIESLPPEIRTVYRQSTASLLGDIQAEQASFRAALSQAMADHGKTVSDAAEAIGHAPDALRETMSAELRQGQALLQGAQQQYEKALSDSTASFRSATESCMSQLNAAYAAFLEKCKASNITQIYQLCQNMNHSLNKKLNIALIAAALALLLSALSLFL